MTILADSELRELIDRGLVQDTIDPEVQVQMCGVDLTLRRVDRFLSAGSIDYDNRDRQISETEKIPFDESGWIALKKGAYLVTFNEIVSISRNLAAMARPRSSLLRCGATMETALWDPGYQGRSQSLLVVYNPSGIRLKKNARLMQMIFYSLSSVPEKGYEGAYQDENL
ncbi:MAG: deoxyuridine 5'-triphosphate nucleotidohydrolase [Methanotrichaceae archaeon]